MVCFKLNFHSANKLCCELIIFSLFSLNLYNVNNNCKNKKKTISLTFFNQWKRSSVCLYLRICVPFCQSVSVHICKFMTPLSLVNNLYDVGKLVYMYVHFGFKCICVDMHLHHDHSSLYLSLSHDDALHFSRLKCDQKITERWINGTSMPFRHLSILFM